MRFSASDVGEAIGKFRQARNREMMMLTAFWFVTCFGCGLLGAYLGPKPIEIIFAVILALTAIELLFHHLRRVFPK